MRYQSILQKLMLYISIAIPLPCVGAAPNTKALHSKSLNPEPYILPSDHSLRPLLSSIFTNSSIIKNPQSFAAAGFSTKFYRKRGSLRVAKHRSINGYLFKVYLTNETHLSLNESNRRLILRAKSAAAVRRLIAKNHIRNFSAPNKWLYPITISNTKTAYVLIVQDMQLVSRSKSIKAWKKKMRPKYLKELYILLRAGYGSMAVDQNIPYTKSKSFSFIDLEFEPRKFDLYRVNKYLSRKAQSKWKRTISR